MAELAELLQPLLLDVEAAVARAATEPTDRRPWSMIVSWLDVLLLHRQTLGMMFYDLTMLVRWAQYQRYLRVYDSAIKIISGGQGGQAGRIRAIQCLAMISDPPPRQGSAHRPRRGRAGAVRRR